MTETAASTNATPAEEEEEWPSWSTGDQQDVPGTGGGSSAVMDSDDDGPAGGFETVKVRNKLFPSFAFGSAVANIKNSFNAQVEKSRPAVTQSARNLDDKLHLSEKVAVLSKQVEAFKKTAAVIDTKEEKKIKARKNFMTPEAILNSKGCTARVLTVSDQHATVLLTHSGKGHVGELKTSDQGEEGEEAKFESDAKLSSLLKLAVVPFHKNFLVKQSVYDEEGDGDEEGKAEGSAMNDSESNASREILSFLSQYRFNLKSESGAEYSYYDASPARAPAVRPQTGEVGLINAFNKALNGISGSLAGEAQFAEDGKKGAADSGPSNLSGPIDVSLGCFTVELISPASERQIQRAMPAPATALVEETPEIYDAVTRPFIEDIVSGGSLDWITNIIEGRKEKERLLLDHEQYILNVDTKWRSHPDCNSTPREQWYKHESTEDMYCLAILKQKGVASIRDLHGEHIPVLQSMLSEGTKAIEAVYGVPRNQIRVFAHYQPQFYSFHVHFTRLHNEIGCQVERGHLVSDIIQNLELDSDFYAKRTITYRLKLTDDLYKRISAHKDSESTEDTKLSEEKELDVEVTEDHEDDTH